MDAKTIIQKLGGPSAAARFFECRPAAISQWKRDNKIPPARMLHLKAARPDLFDQPPMRSGESKDDAPEPEVRSRSCGDRREDDRRSPEDGFGEFGERRGSDRRDDDRRTTGQEAV